MNLDDRRARRTRKALGAALVSLVLEQGYDDLTVRAIAERADVAHATFYRHYRDKHDLLTHLLDATVGEIEAMVRAPALRESEGVVIFRHAHENANLYRVLLGSPAALPVRRWLLRRLAAHILSDCHPVLERRYPDVPVQLTAYHQAASLLVLIEWWLDQGTPMPPQRMAEVYDRLRASPSAG
jgi:AcrR family transcriptional regulator